jgi:hypothetical protein
MKTTALTLRFAACFLFLGACSDNAAGPDENGGTGGGNNDDTDGGGTPSEQSGLACELVEEKSVRAFAVEGARSDLLVDSAVDRFGLVQVNGAQVGAYLADSNLGVGAVVFREAPTSTLETSTEARERALARWRSLGTISVQNVRQFRTVEGYAAEQVGLSFSGSSILSSSELAGELAGAALSGTLSGLPDPLGGTGRDFRLSFLVVIRPDEGAVFLIATEAENASPQAAIRLEEWTDGTNIARLGSFTRPDCERRNAEVDLKADILLVLDDSGSMKDDQEAVGAAAGAMGEILEAAAIDYRLGVVRMWAEDGTQSARRGELRGTGFTRDLAQFGRDANIGAKGGWEPGLETGLIALSRLTPATDDERPDRLRSGVATVVVHVSDERDQNVECLACGDCDGQEGVAQMCLDPAGEPAIDEFARRYRAEGVTTFALVSDLPNGCRQPAATDDFEPGQGYVEVAQATGGRFGSICGDMRQNLEGVARLAAAKASKYVLPETPASATLQVLVGPDDNFRELPRSRTNGFDYDAASNAVVLFGDLAPESGETVRIAYRIWDREGGTIDPGFVGCNPLREICTPTCETGCGPGERCDRPTGLCRPDV